MEDQEQLENKLHASLPKQPLCSSVFERFIKYILSMADFKDHNNRKDKKEIIVNKTQATEQQQYRTLCDFK